MPHPTRPRRHAIARTRLINILRKHIVAPSRTLEQKISDAGPGPLRVDPHILTAARRSLEKENIIHRPLGDPTSAPWFSLTSTPQNLVNERLAVLKPIYDATQQRDFTMRAGQTLEIAIFKALRTQQDMHFFGSFPDLDDHDDSQLYTKEEPPISISGLRIKGNKRLDFLLIHSQAGRAGIEAKNVREWLYPDRDEVLAMLSKCCDIDAIPILIARRIPYVTYSILNPCGVIIHQTYNQLYPSADHDLAEKARDKTLLGYHDIRVGNDPDRRLLKFVHDNLPPLLPKARPRFQKFKDLLFAYSKQSITYKEFAWKVKRREKGLSEDFTPIEPEEEI